MVEDAFVDTKRKPVDECDLWAIVSLPGSVFSGAGAAVKTNLLYFTARRKQARVEMQPHVVEAERLKAMVLSLKEKLKTLKKTVAKTDAIEALEAPIEENERSARDSQSKADAIGAIVFDL